MVGQLEGFLLLTNGMERNIAELDITNCDALLGRLQKIIHKSNKDVCQTIYCYIRNTTLLATGD